MMGSGGLDWSRPSTTCCCSRLCLWLWRRQCWTLLIGLPLVLVNLLSASASYAPWCITTAFPLRWWPSSPPSTVDWRQADSAADQPCPGVGHSLLAGPGKPWFFTGPYLQRLPSLKTTQAAIAMVQPDDAVLSTSYLVPQLSQRQRIAFPASFNRALSEQSWRVLFQPGDPGWGSTSKASGG